MSLINSYKCIIFDDTMSPAFSERNVPVFCSTDDNFAPYCGVMLQSIIEHASPAWNYDLIVLQCGLSDENHHRLSSLADGADNITIRLYDVSEFILGKSFRHNDIYSLAIYYRLFAPSIFAEYDKIIYLDVDVVALSDIAELYSENIGENWLGGCSDLGIDGDAIQKSTIPYYINTIGVADISQYVNSGVLIMNTGQMRKYGVEQACIKAAITHGFYDQDALNHVCRGHIHYLDLEWNTFPARGFENYLEPAKYKLWDEKKKHPRIIHYVGEKPWANPFSDMAVHWWQAAARTPYYDELQLTLLHRLIGHVVHYKRDLWRYRVCRILSKLTFGKMKNRLAERKRSLRRHLRLMRSIIEDK